jgi:rhamnopyranosyl-N-acetylglucosaminyl-diphospho-decaprenol beta-1,3/1,4-galactofuranosyltransferase
MTAGATGGSSEAVPPAERVAVVVVTYNRADLLVGMLDGLAEQTRPPDAVIVVNNASSDHTRGVLDERDDLPLQAIHSPENLGGAGGFHRGVAEAYAQGFDRIWLMDDDVVPAPHCLETLLRHDRPCLMAVREDRRGTLVEKSALHFDLRNPLALRPKRASVDSTFRTRAEMPELVPVEVVAFEGFLVRRDVIDAIGLPDPAYFIFYDDADYAIRARKAGFTIQAVRDAVLVRQLDFDQQHDLGSWKGRFMYRNLFVVHFRYGENALVRAKPYLIAAGVVGLSPIRKDGRREAGNVIRALREARGLRSAPGPETRTMSVPKAPRR